MSKVSIIVPIYNTEKYLDKCITSLINQTFSDIEILLINDGSTDNSENIVNNYSDERIRYVNKENGGYGSVLELGIKEAKSKYFLICDSDDYLKENCVEVLYNKANEYNLDIVVGSKELVYIDNNEKVYSDSKIENVCPTIKEDKTYDNITDFYFLEPSPHSKLFKVELAQDVNFPHKVSYTDYLLYSLCLEKAKRVMYLKDDLSCYLVNRPGNSTTDVKPKVFNDYYVVIRSVFEQMNSEVMYARQYIHFRYVLSLFNNTSIDVKKQYFDKYMELYKILIENRNKVLKYLPQKSFKTNIVLCGLFEELQLRRLMGL